MSDRKSADDVQQLLKDKLLGDLQYREFTPTHAARLTLAKAQAPESGLPAADPVPVAIPAAPVPPPAQRSAPVAGLPSAAHVAASTAPANATPPKAPRSAVHESPLNFTFERLRRQVIPARANGPLIDLQLAPRHRAIAAPRLELLRKRVLSEVFQTLMQTPDARQRGA